MDIWQPNSQKPERPLRLATLGTYLGERLLVCSWVSRQPASQLGPSLLTVACVHTPYVAAAFIAVNVASSAGLLGATNAGGRRAGAGLSRQLPCGVPATLPCFPATQR